MAMAKQMVFPLRPYVLRVIASMSKSLETTPTDLVELFVSQFLGGMLGARLAHEVFRLAHMKDSCQCFIV